MEELGTEDILELNAAVEQIVERTSQDEQSVSVENKQDAPKNYMMLNGMYGCSFCEKKFTMKTNLTRHKKVHDDLYKPNLTCKDCGKLFSTTERRNAHEKAIHQGFVYQCPLCNITRVNKYAIVKHFKNDHSDANLNILPFLKSKAKINL